MQLTTAELAALNTDARSPANDAALGAFIAAFDDQAIADWYNTLASPDFWVWRTAVTKGEYVQTTSVDGTVFAWTGAGFITRSAGEQAAWRELFGSDASGQQQVNPSLANVRQAFQDIFSGGTAPAPANRTHLATVSRRKATRVEKMFATGTGSTASPATMALGAEGMLTYLDVARALRGVGG